MTDTSELPSSAPPSTGWVVHEVARSREADESLWAWCKVQVDQPGYTEVYFTGIDGTTAASGPDHPRLGRVLFQVWC